MAAGGIKVVGLGVTKVVKKGIFANNTWRELGHEYGWDLGEAEGPDALEELKEHHHKSRKIVIETEGHVSHSELYNASAVGPSRREHARAGEVKRNQCTPTEFKAIREKIGTQVFGSGINETIGRDGLAKLVTALSVHEAVEETEIDWIFAMVDKQHKHCISFDQVLDVNAAIDQWVAARQKCGDLFKKYDHGNSGIIDREELRHLLIDLNDGLNVDDKQLEEVIHNSAKYHPGSLVMPELVEAMAFWYGHVKPPDDIAHHHDRAKGGAVGRAQTSLHQQHIRLAQMNEAASSEMKGGTTHHLEETGFPSPQQVSLERQGTHHHHHHEEDINFVMKEEGALERQGTHHHHDGMEQQGALERQGTHHHHHDEVDLNMPLEQQIALERQGTHHHHHHHDEADQDISLEHQGTHHHHDGMEQQNGLGRQGTHNHHDSQEQQIGYERSATHHHHH